MAKIIKETKHAKKPKVSRKGIHCKSKSSKIKRSKSYLKRNIGQGH